MRFYINWNRSEYLISSISWYSDGRIMYVTFYDDAAEVGFTTLFRDDHDLDKLVYTRKATAGTVANKK